MELKTTSSYLPTGDQPRAVAELTRSLQAGERYQTLLGATGTGKTATMAWIIEQLQRPALVIAHNKTLAAQLCNEFREFFPANAVEYFVSYYDYYQPEAYVPQADLYIEKDSSRNDDIDRLRHAATSNLLQRRDTVIVASVSCIYGLGSPEEYEKRVVFLTVGEETDRDVMLRKLIDIQYVRNDTLLGRGRFRVKGDVIEIQPAYTETAYRISMFGDEVEQITHFDPLTGEVFAKLDTITVFPATQYVTSKPTIERAAGRDQARARAAGGAVRGRGPDARGAPDPPAHRVRPGDDAGARLLQRDRELLADPRRAAAGLGAAHAARLLPLRLRRLRRRVAPDRCRRSAACTRATARASRRWSTTASACRRRSTTGRSASTSSSRRCSSSSSSRRRRAPFELRHSTVVAEQLIRPTGIVDPEVELRPTKNQIDDLLNEIRRREEVGERVLVTTLTKKMSEDLTDYLLEAGVRARYLHSEIDTLERIQIIRELRLGEYDVLVGVNLLREGLDLPEVSLVAMLDADKEGFLRGKTALVQTIGRAARNVNGRVLLYADKMTEAIKGAIEETERRRAIQLAYNEEHGITPISIVKGVSDIAEFLQLETPNVPGRRRRGGEPRSKGCRATSSRSSRSRSRRRCSWRPRSSASSTRPSCATRSRTCAASCSRSPRALPRRVRRNSAVPPGRAARPDAASSVAPIATAIGAPCVLASERASHPGDEHHSAKPS